MRQIKEALLEFRRAGSLDRVKLLMLTNCTFDSIAYDVSAGHERVLGDQAGLRLLLGRSMFAFARFHPAYRPRTAMRAARTMIEALRLPEYQAEYAAYAEQLARKRPDSEALLDRRLLPDPARTRVRGCATQSTHRTLTALRQGTMIHVYDHSVEEEDSFREAYMAHTSTSPNHQILASLDAIDQHPLLHKYVRCPDDGRPHPRKFRPSGIDQPLRTWADPDGLGVAVLAATLAGDVGVTVGGDEAA